jgi:hypothetical protein
MACPDRPAPDRTGPEGHCRASQSTRRRRARHGGRCASIACQTAASRRCDIEVVNAAEAIAPLLPWLGASAPDLGFTWSPWSIGRMRLLSWAGFDGRRRPGTATGFPHLPRPSAHPDHVDGLQRLIAESRKLDLDETARAGFIYPCRARWSEHAIPVGVTLRRPVGRCRRLTERANQTGRNLTTLSPRSETATVAASGSSSLPEGAAMKSPTVPV